MAGKSLSTTKISLHLPIHRRARLGLGYLPQEASIFRRLTVAQNIQAVLELQGITDDNLQNHLEKLLEDLHITHIRDNPAISLSRRGTAARRNCPRIGDRPALHTFG